jgi:hypothetical protein
MLSFNAPAAPLQAPKPLLDRNAQIRDETRRTYAAMVTAVDDAVGELTRALTKKGMLDNTLVLCLGEFGRTPKVNKDTGRDHWPGAMSVLMAGAGIPGGLIVGATDPKGYYASENIYSPEDFAVSVYSKLGVDPTQVLHTSSGRPVQLVNGGRQIKELFV